MYTAIKPGWSKPATILFASQIPVNEKAFDFALAQAVEFGAKLILFHAYDTMVVTESDSSGIRYYDSDAVTRIELEHLEPLSLRVREAGIECETVVRRGLAAEQIIAFLGEREIDRIVMGTHSPGPIGKLLVGSVAEVVLRSAKAPVCIIGPAVVNGRYRNFATRTILCAVSLHESSHMVVRFAAELAAEQNARLILQHVIRPQDQPRMSVDQINAELLSMIPPEREGRITVQTIIVPGEPTEELLYQSLSEQADLLVLGAQGASAFAAIARQGVVYKLLAHSHCPVLTLSPIVLAAGGAKNQEVHSAEVFLAGVF
ncbi:MAG: universal stress protein [Terracidiphilus sp.]|jgi:nucleotide-binding universal stress UspA family protein